MTKGKFITFEGPEGSGKSTQAIRLTETLKERGYSVINPREPGGTKTGELIRGVLQHGSSGESLVPACEALLFEASRAQLTESVIRPTLERGGYVVCDRFYDSTTVYQGYGRGFDPKILQEINLFATQGLVPDLTFLLDLEVDEGFKRITKTERELDTMEKLERNFHERVRNGYLTIAKNEPERFRIIDALQDPESVYLDIWNACLSKFQL